MAAISEAEGGGEEEADTPAKGPPCAAAATSTPSGSGMPPFRCAMHRLPHQLPGYLILSVCHMGELAPYAAQVAALCQLSEVSDEFF